MKHFLWCKYEWKIMAGVFPQQRKQLFMSRLTIGSARIPPGLQAHYLCPGKSLSGLLIFSQWVMALFIARSALHWLRLLNPQVWGDSVLWKACVISLPYGYYFILLSSITLACQRCTCEARCVRFCWFVVFVGRDKTSSLHEQMLAPTVRLQSLTQYQLSSHGVPLAF